MFGVPSGCMARGLHTRGASYQRHTCALRTLNQVESSFGVWALGATVLDNLASPRGQTKGVMSHNYDTLATPAKPAKGDSNGPVCVQQRFVSFLTTASFLRCTRSYSPDDLAQTNRNNDTGADLSVLVLTV
jgi:hypothetical protein